MATLQLKNINKIYDNNVQAVFDFNLEISDKEFIVLVGPSGCGKSTTLRMIAGLEDISSGELWINEQLANDKAPKDRDIAMVFQSYALYPHMSVYENMAFGLRLKKLPKDEIDRRVHESAKILEIEQYLDRKPKALSGGQRQRVALGRAIVRNAQEQRQLALIEQWLQARGYRKQNLQSGLRLQEMERGSFSFRQNVVVRNDAGKSVNIPVDAVIMPFDAPSESYPVLIEAKSAGDFTNTNKRRKEEATKVRQLKQTYGESIDLTLFLCGYFDAGYLGYEAAEGIDWVWEHRIDDMEQLLG